MVVFRKMPLILFVLLIVAGLSVRHVVASAPLSAEESWTFEGFEGDEVTVIAAGISGMRVEVRDPEGVPIAEEVDNDGTGNLEFVILLRLSGTYTLIVSHDSDALDAYELVVQINGEAVDLSRGRGADNCVIIEGQRWHASGGTGGMITDIGKVNGIQADFGEVGNLITQFAPNVDASRVAILVVDDYTGDHPDQVLPTVTVESDLDSISLSHGDMVRSHITYLLEAMGFSASVIDSDRTDWDVGGTSNLTVIKLNVPNYSTKQIADDILMMVRSLEENEGIYRFVFNMSFSILPCETAYEYQNFRDSGAASVTLYDYYKATYDPSGDIAEFQNWIQAQLALVGQDPLLALFTDLTDGDSGAVYTENSVFVASAGNEPLLNFPLYPGAWDTVIGVSAYHGSDPATWTAWTGSSIGDVILPGAWYQYPGATPLPMYYAGTSFAAPVMSVIAALRLTHSAQECPFNQAPPVIAAATYPDVTSIPPLEDILQAAGCP